MLKRILLFLLAAFPLSAAADEAGVFGQGRTHFLVTGGTGSSFNQTYLVLGLGVTYYAIDGLGLGVNWEAWTGSSPTLYKLTPSVQYVFYQAGSAKPYVGAFYRRTYLDRLPDINSAGARAGFYFQAGRTSYIGAGLVYESYLDCNQTMYRSCSATYPELSFTFAF